MNSIPVSAGGDLKGLSGDKANLLKLLLDRNARDSVAIRSHARSPNEFPLRVRASWAQERLWFIDLLENGSRAYNIPLVARLSGKLDRRALGDALDDLLRRHEILRTVLVEEAGVPKQEISARQSFELEIVDLSVYDGPAQQKEIASQRVEEAHSQFELRSGPLIRGRLLCLSATEHVLLITAHHVVADGWSVGVLLRELGTLYSGHVERRESLLPPLPIQYSDFAIWQRATFQGAVLEEELAYWRSHLRDAPPQLELPTDRQRPANRSYRGENVPIRLDSQLTADLKALARRHELTLFMALYAGWALLLSRLSGQHDLVIGTPVANRQRPELEGLIGFFVNTLALRVEVKPEISVLQFLAQVRQVTLGAYNHQDVPFERVVADLQPERSLSRNPVFQVMFALQNAPSGDARMSGVTVTLEEGQDEPAIFDLFVSLEERDGEIVGSLNYATDLFGRPTMERYAEYFVILLREMTWRETGHLADLPILPRSEQDKVVKGFNATEESYPKQKLTHEMFEEQAARTADEIAVEHGGAALTYSELNRRANQVARYLLSEGVGPDQPVGIFIERSLDMVVGLLAILKAGGAYLPLDPSYPRERLQQMLEDATPQMVLSETKLLRGLPQTAAKVIALDERLGRLGRFIGEDLPASELGLTPENLVYVIYTSGSTGRPKGTAMPHSSVVNLIEWHRRSFARGEGTRVLQFAALSFDVAFQEIFSTLCTGGTLVLLDEWVRRDAKVLTELLISRSIETLFVPPLMLQSIAEHCKGAHRVPTSLKEVITAGEQLRVSGEIRDLFRRLESCRLHNHYGPTETHVVTALTLEGDPELWPDLPSIGRPIANTQIYVLDGRLQPVPIGIVGEIHIGGAGVARGYLNRPDLTDQRFLADPYSADPQTRLYKTGDLGRWKANGTIEYLGRNDDQVKIRGFRVELGEIEAQLLRHQQVREAVVVAREDVPGMKRLVAYVTSRGDAPPSADGLRGHIKAILPEYMVPSAFMVLEKLPLTPTGKLDRPSLPAPDVTAYASREYEAPQGELEQLVARIWQELLHVERVGRNDNFFELGGHSLLIVQMMERLRQADLPVDVRKIYESQNLSNLAMILMMRETSISEVPPNLIPTGCTHITPQMLPLVEVEPCHIELIAKEVPGGPANIQDIYPLVPLQEGLLFHHLMSSDKGDVYVLPLLFSVPSERLLQDFTDALRSVIRRHDALRTAVLWEHLPRPVQVVYRRAELQVESLTLDEKEDALSQIKQRMRPEYMRLDIRRAPMLGAEVSAAGNGSYYVLLKLHHFLCDHESLERILEEIISCTLGEEANLPPPGAYRRHVAQALARAKRLDAEVFFRTKLGEINESTAPFGLSNIHGNGNQIRAAHELLDEDLARRIHSQARLARVSAATIFHAAWALTISRTSGREDVVYGTLLSGRFHGDVGTERVIGMFINTLPIRLPLTGLSAKELVDKTQRELTDLVSHEHASLALAQRCSSVPTSAPLFTALLNYRHSTVDLDSGFSRNTGIRFISAESWTNYPIVFSVEQKHTDFVLDMETDSSVDPRRLLLYAVTGIRSLLDALERAPGAQALELETVPEAERRELTHSFDLSRGFEQDALIQELFEAQVRLRPSAIALTCDGRSLSYAELNGRANQLAWFLRARGVGSGDLVGICADRGPDLVVGLLGILKAGSAYVPLDPAYPRERLAFVLGDASPVVVLTQEALAPRIPVVNAELIRLDSDWPIIAQQPSVNPGLRPQGMTSSGVAYVIYTSGSTGAPKGVMVEHRNVVRLFRATEELFRFDERDVWTLFHSFAFDFSVWELWGALLYGGRLVIVPYLISRSPDEFYRLLCDERVTILNQTPSAFSQVAAVQGRGSGESNSIRAIIFGGEPLEFRMLKPWVERNGTERPRLVNMYGITETTVHVTFRVIAREDVYSESGSNIGKPIADLRIYLLDTRLRPVPMGVPGEIYVGGAGVARGYLNRDDLTSARFLVDPFQGQGHERMYKSGDIGRWCSDGTIEFLGRNDDQVKIRGFRVELGEIAARLMEHPAVEQAAVVARADSNGEKRLIGYITARNRPSAPSPEDLREHMRAMLPDYMVPTAYVVLEELPLTANGKLNRRALPDPQMAAYATKAFEAPNRGTEEALARIFGEMFGLDRVGRGDGFFEIGGNSIDAIKLIERIDHVLGVRVPIHTVFRFPTVMGMADYLDTALSVANRTVDGGGMDLEEGTL